MRKVFPFIGLAIVGCSIPFFFAVFDLVLLNIEINVSNLYDVMEAQHIYQFSMVAFPFTFTVIYFMYYKLDVSNKALKREFEYLKTFLNSNPDSIIFLDQNFEAIFVNDTFRFMFNHIEDVLKNPEVEGTIKEVCFFQNEMSFNSNITEDHPFLVTIKQTNFNDELNYFVILKDIKNIKDQEFIIQDQNQQMIEKNKLASLGEMAAGIAHEINNPLTVVTSNNSMIQRLSEKEKLTPEKIEKLTSKTADQIVRITEIIRSLRNLSRGLANDEMENFNLHQVLEEALSLAKLRDKTKKILFHLDGTSSYAFGNRGQIIQVIINLINNAIDAVEAFDDPWIQIKVEEKKNFINIRIIDCGRGIPRDQLEKIFIPMYTTKGVGSGTGLGLSLSKSFIEQNKGSLEYELDEGHTCFKVSILQGIYESASEAA